MNSRYIKTLRFVFYPLYFLSFMIPRSKNIWLFGAHHNRFAENSKSLFQYVTQQKSEVTPIWITGSHNLCQQLRKDGYLAYIRWSFKGIYYSLRGKYYFYNLYSDDINYYTSGHAVMVNLWHGIPLKKIEFDIKHGAQSEIFNSKLPFIYHFFKPFIFKKPDYVLSTSTTVSDIFSSAFRIATDQCLEFAYPRCDIFYKKPPSQNANKKNKIVIYMPTWRNDNKNFLNTAFPELDVLNDTLATNKILMYIKLHPNTQTINREYSNILFIESQTDIYEFLPKSDFLITDYSSIFFDYLLLDKEIIFYAFDKEEYTQSDREFYFEYNTVTPGAKVYTFNHLLKLFHHLDALDYAIERKKLKDLLWKYQDGNSSKRIYDYFRQL